MATRIPALIFDGIVEIGCLFFLYFFGDSGINMFVEFWMEGIDDGKNRVGGDLLLMILEALQQHGYEIPFPQREVRILNEKEKEDGTLLRED